MNLLHLLTEYSIEKLFPNWRQNYSLSNFGKKSLKEDKNCPKKRKLSSDMESIASTSSFTTLTTQSSLTDKVCTYIMYVL